MKEKILPFIIGLLVGAIIATGGFLIYQKKQQTSRSWKNEWRETTDDAKTKWKFKRWKHSASIAKWRTTKW